ncbi:MAG: hypothetical protein IJN70_02630, partial [Clostridia bacterium]|nr:hypothetical protein [Clostridia bacterium]
MHYSLNTKKTPQKIRTLFNVSKGLPSDNITRVCFCRDILFAGTDKGLVYLDGDKFSVIEGIAEEVTALYAVDDVLFCGTTKAVYTVIDFNIYKKQSLPDKVVDISGNDDLWLATVSTCYRYGNQKFERFQGFDFESTHAMTAPGERQVFAACPKALLVLHGKRPRWSTLMPSMCKAPSGIRTLTGDSLGNVWLGTDSGVYLYDGRSEWLTPDDFDFFPKCGVN